MLFVQVRHITSGRGVVSGSILFTPNAVIFDPDPKDPLVEELEPEAFQEFENFEFLKGIRKKSQVCP